MPHAAALVVGDHRAALVVGLEVDPGRVPRHDLRRAGGQREKERENRGDRGSTHQRRTSSTPFLSDAAGKPIRASVRPRRQCPASRRTSRCRPASVLLAATRCRRRLVRSASLRCHDCRDVAAPIRADLVEQMAAPLRRRAERLDLVTRDDQIRVVVAALAHARTLWPCPRDSPWDGSGIGRPGPIFDAFAQAGAYGVLEHVPASIFEVALVLDHAQRRSDPGRDDRFAHGAG